MLVNYYWTTKATPAHSKGTGWCSITPVRSVALLHGPVLYTFQHITLGMVTSDSCVAALAWPVLFAMLFYKGYTSCV